MCNYSDYIERSARQEGRQEGRREGIEDTQKENVIRMSGQGFSIEQIANALDLAIEKVKTILQAKPAV